MVCTEKYIYIENKRPQLDAQGAIDVMGGGAGTSLKNGFKAGTLTPFQNEIFSTQRSIIELYDRITDPKQRRNIAKEKPVIVKKMQKVLHRWQHDTDDTEPTHLTPDWYSRLTLKVIPADKQRNEMPGEAKSAKLSMKKGPF